MGSGAHRDTPTSSSGTVGEWKTCSGVSMTADATEEAVPSLFVTCGLAGRMQKLHSITMSRLTRLDWVYTEEPIYFVTACIANRRHLLAEDSVHVVFRDFCKASHHRGVLVGRYVLMPDHFHLFVCIPPGALGLSGWMKSLKNTLSKHWSNQGISSPHWQKGFFDHLIRSNESHTEKWRYVRENPVRAGLVNDAVDWPYGGEIQPDSRS